MYKETFQLPFMSSISIYIVEKLKIIDRASGSLTPIHHRLMSLYSYKDGQIYTMLFVAQMIGAMWLCFLLFNLIAILAEDITLLGVGIFLVIVIPFFLIKG